MIRTDNVPRRIVLSRKGFDSSAGGCASPILDGRMISLPIPEHNINSRIKQGDSCGKKHVTYRDLAATEGGVVAKLVFQLTKGAIRSTDCVHLDPDIRRELRTMNCSALPLTYGQDNGSQTELKYLKEGDLFLFFGWFRDAQKSSNESFRFTSNGVDIHAIWGWLQVAEKLEMPLSLSRAREIASHHPHVSHLEGRDPNCLYVAGKNLTFLPDIAGAGTFDKYQRGLCLSDEQKNIPPRMRLRSNWRLPRFFAKTGMTHHPDLPNWKHSGENLFGKGGAYRGQEFIFKTDGCEDEVAKWLECIFSGESLTTNTQ